MMQKWGVQINLPASTVTIDVCNALGEKVAVLQDGWQDAGTYALRFDAGSLPSGTYLCRIRAGAVTAIQRMLLVR